MTAAVADAPPWLLALLTAPPTPTGTQPSRTENPTFTTPGQDRPGDRWAGTITWHQLLTTDGWQHHHTDRDGEDHWTRPGKETRDGTSATTGYGGSDVLKVFTSSCAPLRAEETYTKIGYIAATRHGGDFRAASAWCRTELGEPAPDPWGTGTIIHDTGPVDPDEPWPDPIPLGADTVLPPFPLGILPDWIANHAQAVADDIQVPVDLPATLALGALSTICASKLKIHITGRWTEDTNLFLTVAMPPSTGKSPAMKAMCSPVHDLEEAYAKQVRGTVAANADMVDILQSQLKKARQLDSPDVAGLARLNEDLFTALEQPTKVPKLTVGDATPEALEKLLADNGGRIAIHSTEGGVFQLMAGRYSEKANLDVYLQAWSGDKIDTERIGREGAKVGAATLTILITVQPTVIAALAEKPELAGRGLTARFMYSMPPDVLGHRDLSLRPSADPAIGDTYHEHVTAIGRRMLSWQTAAILELDPDAALHFTDWRQSMERRRKTDGDLRPMAEWTGKLESSVLRAAALLHVAWGHPHTAPVTLETVAQAIQLGTYWLAHAAHVHDLWGTSEDLGDARAIIAWVKGEKAATFTNRELYNARRSRFQTADSTTPALRLLTERGWIRPMDPGPVSKGGRPPSPRFSVTPHLSTGIASSASSAPRSIEKDLLTLSSQAQGFPDAHAELAELAKPLEAPEAPIVATATERDDLAAFDEMWSELEGGTP